MLAGDKCVLMKERGVMVMELLQAEWRLLLERQGGSDRMQLISGMEEAVVRAACRARRAALRAQYAAEQLGEHPRPTPRWGMLRAGGART